MKVLIRKIRHSDYLGIIDLFNECFEKNIMYHDVESSDNRIIIVADVDNEIVGCAQLDILEDVIENRKYSLISNFCVKNKFQKSGINALLIEACENLCKDFECFEMLTFSNLKHNSDGYKKLGFATTDEIILKKSIEE